MDESDMPRNASRQSSKVVTNWFIIGVSCLGGLLFGYDTGVISGALPYISDEFLSGSASSEAWTLGIVVSSTIWAAALGASGGGKVSDLLGRIRALFIADVVFVTGALCMAVASSVAMVILGRVLLGLGVGIASVVVPVYIAEVTKADTRAFAVATNVFAITGGQLLSYIVNFGLSWVPGTWRWMLGVAALPALLQMAGLSLVPESPRWLYSKGRQADCKAVVRMLVPTSDEQAVLDSISEEVHRERDTQNKGLMFLVQTRVTRAQLHVGVGLQVLQQIAGINTVMYFTPMMLKMAGFADTQQALLISCAPAAVNAAGTVAGMHLVERLGRRKLLLGSLSGVCVALVMLGLSFSLGGGSQAQAIPVPHQMSSYSCSTPSLSCSQCLSSSCSFCSIKNTAMEQGYCLSVAGAQECLKWNGHDLFRHACPNPYRGILIISLMFYLVAFSVGIGPIPWVMNAEIFSLEVRGQASGIAGFANWSTNAVVSQMFLILTVSLSPQGTFALCAMLAFIGTVWAYTVIPETRGLTLAQIQELFRSRCEYTRSSNILPSAEMETCALMSTASTSSDNHLRAAVRAEASLSTQE